MKKLILILALVPFISFAQVTYTLSTSTEPYQDLVNPTIPTGTTTYNLVMPFSFYMNGGALTNATVDISDDGYINFGNEGIVPLAAHLNQLNSSTKTSYELTGSAPTRILKLEWKNHGFSATAANNDSISYQIWLYETTNVIEWHFGPSAWTTASYGGGVGPFVLIVNNSQLCNIYGQPANPSYMCCGTTCHLNGISAYGKVYKLTPSTSTGINEAIYQGDIVFPNPSNGTVYFSSPDEIKKIEVYSLTGSLVTEISLNNKAEADLSYLSKGTYMLEIFKEKEMLIRKLTLE